MNYYNEKDPKAAAWLRQLIAQGLIPYGVVDERSIEDVEPQEVAKYTQCHWFAGIAGWSLALQLAGWASSRPIWTGSCPCQPYSAAGKGDGFADERHLWPAWFWLIEQCRPAVLVGEQVASAAAGPWFDLVLSDLEGLGYACGAYAGPAAGVGAPHIRDRGYWMAYADRAGLGERRRNGLHNPRQARTQHLHGLDLVRLADSRCDGGGTQIETASHRIEEGNRSSDQHGGCGLPFGRLADAGSERCGGRQRVSAGRFDDRTDAGREQSYDGLVRGNQAVDARIGSASQADSHWSTADWLGCRDGKWRPVEPGTFPLAHGLPARVGRLRGYGNAIVPQQAAQFVKALMEYAP